MFSISTSSQAALYHSSSRKKVTQQAAKNKQEAKLHKPLISKALTKPASATETIKAHSLLIIRPGLHLAAQLAHSLGQPNYLQKLASIEEYLLKAGYVFKDPPVINEAFIAKYTLGTGRPLQSIRQRFLTRSV